MRLIEENKNYIFEYNGIQKPVDGTGILKIDDRDETIHHIGVTEKSIFEKRSNFYDAFSNLKLQEIPDGVIFHFSQEGIYATKPEIIKQLPFPIQNFSFGRVKNQQLVQFFFYHEVYQESPEDWKSKTSVNSFVHTLKSQIADKIEVLDEEGLLILQFYILDSDSFISEIHKRLFTKIENIVQQVESDILDLRRFHNFLTIWESSKNSKDEKKWQEIIKSNSWIISQLFSSPLLMLEDEAFLGGKSLSNKHSNLIDFVYQNELSSNILLIEIKTPSAKLIGKKYRNTHQLSSELSGSVNQILNYRQSVLNEFYSLYYNSEKKFEVINPKSLLLIGSLSDLNKDEKKTFETFRNELKNIDILAFDELFQKISTLFKILKE